MKIDWCNVFGVKPEQVFRMKSGCVVLAGEFKVSENVLLSTNNKKECWEDCIIPLTVMSEIEVLLYPATDAEKIVLNYLDEKWKNGYIARDKDGEICIFENKPEKDSKYYAVSYGYYKSLPYQNLFPWLQFETGAVPIRDIIG